MTTKNKRRNIFVLLISLFVVLFFIQTISAVKTETLTDTPDISSRTTIGYSPNATDGHPSVCQMTNGSYVMVYGSGIGIKLRISDTPDDFSGQEHTIIGNHRQPDIQCWNGSLWISLSNRDLGSIELWNCSEGVGVTDSTNWNKVSTVIDDGSIVIVGTFNEDPIDSSLYMFEEPVDGHYFWLECLDRNGTGEDNDDHRYIFYSDDPTANNWSLGNDREPVISTMIADKGNWPVDALYVPEAEGWIIFNNQNGNDSKADIYYAYTNDINTTWTVTWQNLIPNDVNESWAFDDDHVLEPDILRINDTLYVYYAYMAGVDDLIAGITTFDINGFFEEKVPETTQSLTDVASPFLLVLVVMGIVTGLVETIRRF